MRYRRLIATALCGAVLTVLPACGDGADDQPARGSTGPTIEALELVTISESTAISLPGQVVPAATDTVTLWLGPEVARRDVSGGTLLVDAARDRLVWLDHARGTYTTQTGPQLRRQLAALAADTLGLAADDPRLERLKSMLDVVVKVTATDDVAEIDGYRCKRWIVEQAMGEQTTISELWLTRDIPVDWDLLHRISQPTLAALPGGTAAVSELARLEGLPVRSVAVLEVMGRKGRTESRLASVRTVRVPASHFAPPAGYTPTGGTDGATAPAHEDTAAAARAR
jgi:hypothetical protein